jgi:hypothetical protein
LNLETLSNRLFGSLENANNSPLSIGNTFPRLMTTVLSLIPLGLTVWLLVDIVVWWKMRYVFKKDGHDLFPIVDSARWAGAPSDPLDRECTWQIDQTSAPLWLAQLY